MSGLVSKGIVVTDTHNKMKMDRTKWYRIDYDVLMQITSPLCKSCTMESATFAPPIPETNSEKFIMDNDVRFTTHVSWYYLDRGFEFDQRIEKALSYYYDRYERLKCKKHPRLKQEQLENIYESFDFIFEDWEATDEQVKKLIDDWYDRDTDTDYNINHFATPRVLHTRMESIY